MEGGDYTYNSLRESVPNYDLLHIAVSKWVATQSAKDWITGLKTVKNRKLDEILLSEVLCSNEGSNLVSKYNQVAGTALSKEQLEADIVSNNELLCLKIEYYFEPFLDNIDQFTPVISDFELEVAYVDGETYNPDPVLAATGGDMVIYFKLSEAVNTALYDPTSQTFSTPLHYVFCSEPEIYTRFSQMAPSLCSGEIPLSISYDIQPLYLEICRGNPPVMLMEICDNDIDDDGDGLVDCEDPDCCSDVICGCSEICDNDIDDDGDGLVDCDDPDCCGVANCDCSEICDNGIDDDGDGLIDEDDPDCFGVDSPCMRDHYLEDNFFYEIELQEPQQITALGGNLCGGVISFAPPFTGQGFSGPSSLYSSSLGTATAIEEWYDFFIKIHWGTPTGSEGQFQDIIYRFHLFQLGNEPEFTISYYSGGTQGTGGAAGVAILTLTTPGLSQTIPATLGPLQFYVISDICGMNNWDPGILGDKVAISIHEFDDCTLQTSSGDVTTTTTVKTYSSSFDINIGFKKDSFPLTGGILYKNSNQLATTQQNQISSSYQTNFSNDYYLGRLNYSYCWSDQGTPVQIHELPFGNLVYLRMSSEICN